MLTVYPASGEATITRCPAGKPPDSRPGPALEKSGGSDRAVDRGTRAKGKVRRYVRANRMTHLYTLTYAAVPTDRGDVARHVRLFFENLREKYGRRPWVCVTEYGDQGGRLHLHFVWRGRLPIKDVRWYWPHGRVMAKYREAGRERWKGRELARYLAKYVAKGLQEVPEDAAAQRADGQHRYYKAQGFEETPWRFRHRRIGSAYERMTGLYGQPDDERPFGTWAHGEVFGMWYVFPDQLCHPPPGP